MTEKIIFDILDACLINFVPVFHIQKLQKIVFLKFSRNICKNLPCLKTPHICYFRHAEQYAKSAILYEV